MGLFFGHMLIFIHSASPHHCPQHPTDISLTWIRQFMENKCPTLVYWPFLHSNHSGSYRPFSLSPGPFVPANVDFWTAAWRPSSQFILCQKTARGKSWLYLWHRSLLCRTVKIRGQTIGVSTYRYLPRDLSNLIVSQATAPQALFSKAVLKPTLLFQSWRVGYPMMPKQSS